MQQLNYGQQRGRRCMPLTRRILRLRQLAKGDSHMRDRLLGGSRFTRQDVIDVTGVAQHQLHNWVSRNWLTLSGEQNPGKGRRRLYAGSDIINVAFGLELQPFGLMQVADRLARTQQVTRRAYGMLLDANFESGRAFAIVPCGEGDWRYVAFGPGTARSGHDFCAAVIVDLDRIILETLERLMSLEMGEQLPGGRPDRGTGTGRDATDDAQVWSGELITEDIGDEYFMNSGRSASF
jgi:hypothetical protein